RRRWRRREVALASAVDDCARLLRGQRVSWLGIAPPPRSAVFPYATLFRSTQGVESHVHGRGRGRDAAEAGAGGGQRSLDAVVRAAVLAASKHLSPAIA